MAESGYYATSISPDGTQPGYDSYLACSFGQMAARLPLLLGGLGLLALVSRGVRQRR